MHIIRNGTFTTIIFTNEILILYAVFYIAAIDNSFISVHDNVGPQIQLILRIIFFILKQYGIRNMQHALLNEIRQRMFETHSQSSLNSKFLSFTCHQTVSLNFFNVQSIVSKNYNYTAIFCVYFLNCALIHMLLSNLCISMAVSHCSLLFVLVSLIVQ